MITINGDTLATALARYVRDFVPGQCHGVTTIRVGTTGDVTLGVFGKPGGRDGILELLRYERLLRERGVAFTGSGIAEGGGAWAIVVKSGRLVDPLRTLLHELLSRVAQPAEPRALGATTVAEARLQEWRVCWLRSLEE